MQMRSKSSLFIVLGFTILIAGRLFAADTGRITGTVVDKKTGEPIAGANVVIEGTTLGAMTDLDGFFSIINIKPGKYSVKATYIGYVPMLQKDVVVSIDINTQLPFPLEPTVLEAAEPVEVFYEKPAVIPGVTSTERRLTKEHFDVLPVNDISDMLSIQAGIKVDNEGKYHVRGGRDDEVLFIVGGLEVNDQLGSGRRTFNMPKEAINEVQVMTGSFDAEYSNALSGVINQSLESGSSDRYSGRFTWQTDRWWEEYSFDTDRLDFNLGGPVPIFRLAGKPVTFSITAWGELANTYTPFNVDRPNSDLLGIGLDIPERQDNVYGFVTNTVFPISDTKKLTMMVGGGRSQWDFYPTGDWLSGNYGYQYKYNVVNRPYVKKKEQLFNLKFANQVSSNAFYDISFGRYHTNTQTLPRNATPGDFTMVEEIEDIYGGSYLFPASRFNFIDNNGNTFHDGFIDANGNGKYDGWGEGYEDLNSNGQWDRGEDFVDLNGNGVYDGGAFDPATGQWVGEPILDDKDNDLQWDPGEHFVDLNGNGVWDGPEPQLAEQDWNGNGRWDGERFVDANGDGEWNGSEYSEGYDDYNGNGKCDLKMLFSNETEDRREPFYDGDLWYDTGEPFVDELRYEDGVWQYNGVYDAGEQFWDLPSSYTPLYGNLSVPTLNGQYDRPNNFFDEYELFTRPAGLEYGMDPRKPVHYTYNLDAHGSDWMFMPRAPSGVPGYLVKANTSGRTTWVDRNGDGIFNTPNGQWDPTEVFEDYNGNGEWNGFDYFLNPGTWDALAYYQDRSSTEYTLRFNYQNQVSAHHTFSVGGQIEYSEFEMQAIQNPDEPYISEIPLPPGSPWPERGSTRDFYKYQPWEGGLFLRDVMEWEGLIIKASVRFDFYLHDKGFIDKTTQLTEDYPYFTYTNRRGRYKIAPRLGISHPITRKSKLFFNYSHKYQRPRYDYYFSAATSNLLTGSVVGNPDLEYEKTVEYELGIETEVGRYWIFKVAGYYKDIYNTMGTVPIVYGPLNFDVRTNTDYGRGQGVEFSIEKKFSQNYLVNFKYDFSFAKGKASSDMAAVQQRLENVPVNYDEYPLGWDERHRINLYASLRFQKDEHPRLFGIRLPDDWLATILWEYGSGTPYTPSQYTTGESPNLILANSARMPWNEKTSLKLEKYFRLGASSRNQLILGIDVDNLFDKKNINTLYSQTGSPYYAIHPANPSYDPYGSRYDYDRNPRNFNSGRNVMFRIGYQF